MCCPCASCVSVSVIECIHQPRTWFRLFLFRVIGEHHARALHSHPTHSPPPSSLWPCVFAHHCRRTKEPPLLLSNGPFLNAQLKVRSGKEQERGGCVLASRCLLPINISRDQASALPNANCTESAPQVPWASAAYKLGPRGND